MTPQQEKSLEVITEIMDNMTDDEFVLHNLQPGQYVRMKTTVGDAPCGDSPGGMYAREGEILVIRKVTENSQFYKVHVSHDFIVDSTFGVNLNEIEIL